MKKILSSLLLLLTVGHSGSILGPEWISFISYYGNFSNKINQDLLGDQFHNQTINKWKILTYMLNQENFKNTSMDWIAYYNIYKPDLTPSIRWYNRYTQCQ